MSSFCAPRVSLVCGQVWRVPSRHLLNYHLSYVLGWRCTKGSAAARWTSLNGYQASHFVRCAPSVVGQLTYVQRESRQRIYCVSSSFALSVSLSSSFAFCVLLSFSFRLVCFVVFVAVSFASGPRVRRGGVRLRLVCFVLFFAFVVFAFGFASRAHCAQLLRHNFGNLPNRNRKLRDSPPLSYYYCYCYNNYTIKRLKRLKFEL